MLKNFIVKKGDQLSFTITFTSSLPITNIEFGVKKEYTDQTYTIIESLNEVKRKVVFIGDSYAEGYTPDGRVIGWPFVIDNTDKMDCIIKYKGGTGFISVLQAGTFTQLLDSLNSDNKVTDVIVAGGYNDRYGTTQQILDGIRSFCALSRSKFPNANIKIGMVGWSTIVSQQPSLRNAIAAYKQGCIQNNVQYMTDVENSIHNADYLSSDQIHPNQTGENVIANNILEYLPTIYNGNITKLSDTKYQITIPSEDTLKLDIDNYVYDLRIKINNTIKTPLSGKIFVKDTVFEVANG